MNTQTVENMTPGLSDERSVGPVQGVSVFGDMQVMTTGLLSRGLRWLQTRNTARKSTRRLQVCATVALGEKRFVSVIECDGVQFLIGGGAANVSLLAQLPPRQDVNADHSNKIHAERAQ